jgi:hypothetical protein
MRPPCAHASRDEALARAGFGDIFKGLKDKENALALGLLPGVLAELDAVADARGCTQGGRCWVGAGRVKKAQAAAPRAPFAVPLARVIPHAPSRPAPPAPHPPAGARLELALRGVFAGNVFDMGCAETAQRANEAGTGGAAGAFSATRGGLLPRPWVSGG